MKVLVARRTLLPVPALLIHQHNGRQQAQPFHRERDVRQVGNGAVAVLKIKGVQKLLGALGADLGQRLAHRQRGAGILGHGIGQNFRVGAMNGENFGLIARAGGEKSIHWTFDVDSRPEYGIEAAVQVRSCPGCEMTPSGTCYLVVGSNWG